MLGDHRLSRNQGVILGKCRNVTGVDFTTTVVARTGTVAIGAISLGTRQRIAGLIFRVTGTLLLHLLRLLLSLLPREIRANRGATIVVNLVTTSVNAPS